MRNLSPELLRRIDAVNGCQGRWIVDCRAIEGDYSFAFRDLSDNWRLPTEDGERYWRVVVPDDHPYKSGTPEDAAAYCAATGWRCKLLWQSQYLDDDCSWPGGYSAPSIYRSNARVFRDDFAKELAKADGDGPGLSLDIRFVTDDMLEILAALESYPLISEDDHSQLEMELQQEAWEQWAADDFRKEVGKRLQELAPEDADDYWGSELADDIDATKLQEAFYACCEAGNLYWQEEQGEQWLNVEDVAAQLTVADLADLTGATLLPWEGAEPAPLLP